MKQYKPRDKVTQKITREGCSRRKPDHGQKRKYQRQRKGGGFFREASFYRGKIVPCRNWTAISDKAEQAADKAEVSQGAYPKEEKADS